MKPKQLIPIIFYILIGLALLICGLLNILDSFWCNMGGTLIFVGVFRIVRFLIYRFNSKYKEQVDISVTDERNRFLRANAWAWAGYLFILISAVATITFKVLEMEREMMMCSYAVCLILVLYWVSYLILRKKY